MTPMLFNIYQALKEWKWQSGSMRVHVGDDTLYTFVFADDQVTITEDQEDPSYMFRNLQE